MATEPLDLLAISAKWFRVCGACDAGVPGQPCVHPDEDYRPTMLALAEEVEQLRAQVASLTDERDAAQWELARWRSGQRHKGLPVVEAVPDGLEYAAALVRAQGSEGGEELDLLLVDAAQRLKALNDAAGTLLAEAVVLRAERDDARAERDKALRQCESLGRRLAVRHEAQVKAETDRDWARAERDAMLPVVEAAKAWAAKFNPREPRPLDADYFSAEEIALDNAARSLPTDTPAPTEEARDA